MQIVGSDSPSFYRAAAVIREHLPLVAFNDGCKIIFDENRYYSVINIDNIGNVVYDHVCLDPWYMTPSHIFMVLTTVFSMGAVINAFVDPANIRSKKFLIGVGFTKTGILRQVNGNWEIYSMTRAEWYGNRVRRHFIQKQTQNEKQTQ